MIEYTVSVVHKSHWVVKVDANTTQEALDLAKYEVKDLIDRGIVFITGKGERKGLNQDSSIGDTVALTFKVTAYGEVVWVVNVTRQPEYRRLVEAS